MTHDQTLKCSTCWDISPDFFNLQQKGMRFKKRLLEKKMEEYARREDYYRGRYLTDEDRNNIQIGYMGGWYGAFKELEKLIVKCSTVAEVIDIIQEIKR